ncbi:hypothetical protein [Chryseobacterium gambrini]|nr:hypothetical protein [Chryseobacterium gambrini]WBX97544.1 hypothetical protein PE065_22260 [Chryseobacterium gambrini]
MQSVKKYSSFEKLKSVENKSKDDKANIDKKYKEFETFIKSISKIKRH